MSVINRFLTSETQPWSLRTLKEDISRLNADLRANPSSHLSQQIRAKTAAYRRLLKAKAYRFKQLLQDKMLHRRIDPPKNSGPYYAISEPMPNGKIPTSMSIWLISRHTSDHYMKIQRRCQIRSKPKVLL